MNDAYYNPADYNAAVEYPGGESLKYPVKHGFCIQNCTDTTENELVFELRLVTTKEKRGEAEYKGVKRPYIRSGKKTWFLVMTGDPNICLLSSRRGHIIPNSNSRARKNEARLH